MLNDRRQSPLVHSVHLYEHDTELIERLRSIVVSALATGNAVLVVATEEHRSSLAHSLSLNWPNWAAAQDAGRFRMVDAQSTLEQFMVEGRPSSIKFEEVVSGLVRECRYTAVSANQGLTVFGEMVSLLWESGNKRGAMELETLWNAMLSQRTFHLHCAYDRRSIANGKNSGWLRQICDHHTTVVSLRTLEAA